MKIYGHTFTEAKEEPDEYFVDFRDKDIQLGDCIMHLGKYYALTSKRTTKRSMKTITDGIRKRGSKRFIVGMKAIQEANAHNYFIDTDKEGKDSVEFIKHHLGLNRLKYNGLPQLSYLNWFDGVQKRRQITSLTLSRSIEHENIFRGSRYTQRVGLGNPLKGILDTSVYTQYDINSHYGSVMADCLYPTGSYQELKYSDEFPVGTLNLESKCLWEYLSIMYVRMTAPSCETKIAIIPRKNNSFRTIFDNSEKLWEGYYTNIDVITALEYGYQIELLDKNSGLFWKDSGFIFKEWIDQLYQLKVETKHPCVKRMMTSLYGMMFRKVRLPHIEVPFAETTLEEMKKKYYKPKVSFEKKVYRYPSRTVVLEDFKSPSYLASFILSYSRRQVLDYLKLIDYDYVRFHTDGWICDSKYDEILKPYLNKEMGGLKVERSNITELVITHVNKITGLSEGVRFFIGGEDNDEDERDDESDDELYWDSLSRGAE